MPHGTPDYHITAGAQTTHQLTDLGELAVRLGSPVSHDRRGDVVWYDTFEADVLAWSASSDGAGSSVALDTVSPRSGEQACLLTAGSDGALTAAIAYSLAYPNLSRLGVEFAFQVQGLPDYVQLVAGLFDGATFSQVQIRWDRLNNALQYTIAGGAFVTVATPSLFTGSPKVYHVLKVVWDAQEHTHERLILNDEIYDISGATMPTAASVAGTHLYISIVVLGRAGANDAVRCDDVIVTQNEPS